MSFSQAREDIAIEYLAAHGWKTELAIDSYFQSSVAHHYRVSVDRKKIEALYIFYRGM